MAVLREVNNMAVYEDLLLLAQTKKHVERELRHDHDVLRALLHPDGLIRDFSTANEGSTTCTGFCLFYLSSAGLVGPGAAARGFRFLDDGELRATRVALGASFVRKHASGTPSSGTTDLPNQYNSTLQMAGYLRAGRLLSEKPDRNALKTCKSVINYLNTALTRDGGMLRIATATAPSAYMTFWSCAALREYVDATSPNSDIEALVTRMGNWSERELATGIAYHEAGLTPQFDVIELAYSAVTAVHFSRTPQAFALARRATDLLFRSYFSDGCFARSAPVLATRKNFSLLCSTAEALALLLCPRPCLFFGDEGSLRHEAWEPLRQASLWLAAHRLPEGWYPESDGRHGQPNGFMIASAMAFLAGLSEVLDDVACRRAGRELGVPPFAVDDKLKSIPYPAGVGEILKSHVVGPLREPKPVEEASHSMILASYSMILYGPPGSAKTTVARKLAQDLEWPFLELHQSHFLRQGPGNINAEAERIFSLVLHLKRVVVLFDEIEEMVEERGGADATKGGHDKLSRLLTTSMLPLIHRLRDARRIVFIFATNHVEVIDGAVTRLGRFDIIRCVPPPKEGERRKIIEKLLEDHQAETDVRSCFARLKVWRDEHTKNFGFKDLEALVRTVLVAKRVDGKPVNAALVEKVIRIGQKTIQRIPFHAYEESSGEHDRP